MQNMRQNLQRALDENHIVMTETNVLKIMTFLTLLLKWNKAFNLTALIKPHDLIYAHIIDSLVVAPFLYGNTILDVGTGAGFPGIPLALVHPEKQFTLLDSNSKKTRFLKQVICDLELSNVQVIHARCEKHVTDFGFESIISRAFSSIAVMLKQTEHLLSQDGRFLAMKGLHPSAELKDILHKFVVTDIVPLKIIGVDVQRHLVCIRSGVC